MCPDPDAPDDTRPVDEPADEPAPEEDEDDRNDEPVAEGPAAVEAGETPVAPSTGGTNVNRLVASTSIEITVRRDFPVRRGEKLGAWRWTPSRTAMHWSLAEGTELAADIELDASEDDPLIGWGVGRYSLRRRRRGGGPLTTDHSNPIAARIELLDADRVLSTGDTTGEHGRVELATHGRTGAFVVRITPSQISDVPAGPSLTSTEPLAYERSELNVELRDGLLVAVEDPYHPPSGHTILRVANRRHRAPTTSALPLSLKPAWWHDRGSSSRPGGTDRLRLLVLHCTGGYRIGGALNTFLGDSTGANYLVDIDGHAIKLVPEDRHVVHAGSGRWGDEHDMVPASVGIEIVNPHASIESQLDPHAARVFMTEAQSAYTESQYRTVIRLVREITQAYPSIGRNVVGHCDVATGETAAQRRRRERDSTRERIWPNTYGGKRNWDPGLHFEWSRFEAEGLGFLRTVPFNPAVHYSGLFTALPEVVLNRRDEDPDGDTPGKYGGTRRPDLPRDMDPIAAIKADIRAIGYQVDSGGSFGDRLFAATDRFRRHFVPAGMSGSMEGSIDLGVASQIYSVAATLRAMSTPAAPPTPTPTP